MKSVDRETPLLDWEIFIDGEPHEHIVLRSAQTSFPDVGDLESGRALLDGTGLTIAFLSLSAATMNNIPNILAFAGLALIIDLAARRVKKMF